MTKITGKVGYRDYKNDILHLPDSVMPMVVEAFNKSNLLCDGTYPSELAKALEQKGYGEEVCCIEPISIDGNAVEFNIDVLAYAQVTIEVSDAAAKMANETLKGRIFDTIDHFDSEIIDSLAKQGYMYEDLIYFGDIEHGS